MEHKQLISGYTTEETIAPPLQPLTANSLIKRVFSYPYAVLGAPNLYKSYTDNHSCSECIVAMAMSCQDDLSDAHLPFSGSYTLSIPSSAMYPEPRRGDIAMLFR